MRLCLWFSFFTKSPITNLINWRNGPAESATFGVTCFLCSPEVSLRSRTKKFLISFTKSKYTFQLHIALMFSEKKYGWSLSNDIKKWAHRNRAAMFVANHNSWMDIPFLCVAIGWRNYKLISKAELRKVPILGKAVELGGNVMVDRQNRRSQLQTLKAGMKWLDVSTFVFLFVVTIITGLWCR